MADDPYNIPVSAIGGELNFGNVPAPTDYQSAYQNALNLNKQNYSNILSGYQQTAANQAAGQQSVLAGYGNLGNTIQNTIQGVDASQRQAITDQYVAASGAASQGLISRGLGNTTVANSVQAGLQSDKAKANIALSNQMAQLQAGYQSQIGMAGLGYAGQAVSANTQQANQQLGWMNSVNSPYPNAAQYAALAQQRGAVSAGLGGIGGFRGGGSGGRTTPSPFSLSPTGFGNNYGGGSSAMYSTMGNRNGAFGGGNQSMDFGDMYSSTSGDYSGWAQQDQSGGQQYVGGEEDTGAYDGADYAYDYGEEEDTGAYDGADYAYDYGEEDY